MARQNAPNNPPKVAPPNSFRQAITQNYKSTMLAPVGLAAQVKAAEHGQIIVNLGELATVGIACAATAEWNHTRSANLVWTWRIVELLGGGVVLAYNGTRNTLGRIALGVFTGGLAETLIDSTPGLTGAPVVTPPQDATITWSERR